MAAIHQKEERDVLLIADPIHFHGGVDAVTLEDGFEGKEIIR